MSINSLHPCPATGICVTSIIKDKIREYMMNDTDPIVMTRSSIDICASEADANGEKRETSSIIDEQNRRIRKQDPVSTTGLGLPSTLDVSVHNSSEPCPHRQDLVAASVRRIGNSLDALLHESKRVSQVRAIKKSTTLVNQQSSDGLFISSDQVRYRKGAVTLHDICEEYIQFITVNSSADEETVTTTSENGGDDQNATPELEIIPVNVGTITAASSAGEKRIAQISVITINEHLARNSASVIRKSVEEMHVTPENDCEKSRGESDSNTDKLVSDGNDNDQKDLFPSVNGVKSAVSIEIDEKLVPLPEPAKETNVVPEKVDENFEKPLANGVDHDVNDDIEEEDAVEDEEMPSVDETQPPIVKAQEAAATGLAAVEEPAAVLDECTRMETDELDTELAASAPPESTPDATPDAKPDVENEESASPLEPVSNEPAETEAAELAESAIEPPPVEASADKADLSPSTPTINIASPLCPVKSPVPVEVDHEDEKMCEENEDKVEELVEPAGERSAESSPAEKVESPEEPARSPEETVKSPQENVNSTEKVSSPAEKELVEPSPKASSVVEEKLTCKEEVTTPAPEDFVTNSNTTGVEDIGNDSKIADKTVTPVTKSEPIDKKPQITVKESLKEITLTPTVGGVKRRVEVTDEVEPDRDGGISSSSSGSGSETENTQDCKRIRFDESIFEEDERERLIREFVDRSTDNSEEIGKNCDKLQHEIAALSDLARAKELEWNSIMRLLKLKEEMLERILFKKRHLDGHNSKADLSNLNKQLKNFVSSSSLLDSSNKSIGRSESSVPTTLNSQVTVVPISSSSSSSGVAAAAAASTAAASANGYGVLSSQSELPKPSAANNVSPAVSLDPLNKLRPHRPILPKPPTSSGVSLGTTISSLPSHAPFLSQSSAAAAAVAAQLSSSTQTHPSLSSAAAVATAAAAAAGIGPNSLIIDQNSVVGEGRQGPTVDVKSIIAEFRSKNPDALPRRGRRNLPFASRVAESGPRFIHNNALLSMANMAAMQSASHVRMAASSTTHSDHRPSNFMLGQDNAVSASLTRSDLAPQIRHSNIDSLMLTVNTSGGAMPINSSQQAGGGNSGHAAATAAAAAVAGLSNNAFQEALVKLSKMNEKRDMVMNPVGMHKVATSSSSSSSSPHLAPPPPYPEVTLHPVLAPQQSSGSPPVQNSLLHGILTKSNNNVVSRGGGSSDHHQASSTMGGGLGPASVNSMQQHRPTTFSPTLARLLTTPDRSRAGRSSISQSSRTTKSALSEILNSKKTRTEVTITPVTTSTPSIKTIPDVVMDDDDESEATDRLIIDEGREATADGTSNVIPADQVPECQGCHKKAAQFVCAGCGNQWYCSRECQVQAWEDHSEMCSG